MMIRRILILPVLALLLMLSACSTVGKRDDLWSKTGIFPSCPPRPSCVSSKARDEEYHIPALKYGGDVAAAKARLKALLLAQPRTQIVEETPRYIHAVVVSAIMRYHDDVEFLIEPNGEIQQRSLSRIGYYDFAVNRERLETLRREFSQAVQ